MSALSEQLLSDILSHLASPRPDVRVESLKALSATLQPTSAPSSELAVRMSAAAYAEAKAPATICQLISGPTSPLPGGERLPVELPPAAVEKWSQLVTGTALDAASSLLAAGGEVAAEAFADAGLATRAGEAALERGSSFASANAEPTARQSVVASAVACLANFSRSEAGAASILSKEALLTSLTKAFLDHPAGAARFDCLGHAATLLMNLAQLEAGRKFLLRLSTGYLKALLPSLRSPASARRYGAAGLVKNCCFDKDSAYHLIHELDLVTHVCYPLCGPEGFDMDDKAGMDLSFWMEGEEKVREPDEGTRQILVEAVLLLCATGRRSREALREKKVYEVLKTLDLSEESEAISEKICECVDFLMRDEEGEGGREPVFVEGGGGMGGEVGGTGMSASSVIRSEGNYDDVD